MYVIIVPLNTIAQLELSSGYIKGLTWFVKIKVVNLRSLRAEEPCQRVCLVNKQMDGGLPSEIHG